MSKIIQAYTTLKQADFTIVNQNSHTITDSCGGINIYRDSLAGTESYTLLVKSAPTAPYICTINYKNVIPCGGNGGQGCRHGLCVRDSGTGKFISLCYYGQANFWLELDKFNSITSYNSSYKDVGDKGYDPSWFRVKNDNTNLYWYLSTDGINWSEFSNQAKTDFLANPNQIGFFSLPLYRAATLSINSFKIETTG